MMIEISKYVFIHTTQLRLLSENKNSLLESVDDEAEPIV